MSSQSPSESSDHTVQLHVTGMRCQGCVDSVQKILLDVPGVVSAEVSLEKQTAQVSGQASVEDMINALNRNDFPATTV